MKNPFEVIPATIIQCLTISLTIAFICLSISCLSLGIYVATIQEKQVEIINVIYINGSNKCNPKIHCFLYLNVDNYTKVVDSCCDKYLPQTYNYYPVFGGITTINGYIVMLIMFFVLSIIFGFASIVFSLLSLAIFGFIIIL